MPLTLLVADHSSDQLAIAERMNSMKRISLSVSLALALALLLRGNASAVEPASEFLDGLRERGYYDVAIDYLESAKTNPAVPKQFKDKIPYELGVTLVRGARSQRDPNLREKQLDDGQKVLNEYVAGNPNGLLAISARSELGNVIVERARNRVEKSKKATGADKDRLIKEAGALYSEGVKVFETLEKELAEKLKAYPASLDPKKDAKRYEERDQYRKDYLQAQLLSAAAVEEHADTMPKGSKEQTETLTKAAKVYGEIQEKYRTRIAGMYAQLYKGRCQAKLGKHQEAVTAYNDLLSNPDSPEPFRVLKVKTMELAIPSWIALKQYSEVMSKGLELIDSARPSEDRTDEMMGMRVETARAAKLWADEIKKEKPKDPQIKKLLTDGRKLVTYASKFPSAHQETARKMIADFTGGDAESVASRPEPKTFQEARTAGKESIEAMQAAQLILKNVPPRLKLVKDAAERAELEKQIAEAKEQSDSSQEEALRYLRLALKFADKETSVDDLNAVRYLLCYLLYSDGNYYEAAVIGDFIARRYGDQAQGARQCAKIAMASYLQLYVQSTTEDKTFESQNIINIADYIVKKWPNEPEAAEALNTLIPFMIREKQLAQAQAYLKQIPAESPHRGNAELKTGQALWSAYLEGSNEVRGWKSEEGTAPPGVDLAAREKELETLKTTAKTTLADGVKRMQASGEATPVLSTAVLSLAQIYVDTNEADKAVALLEDPKIGALTLARKNDETVSREGVPEEIYKTALRAYISSLGGAANPDDVIKKARTVMDDLKKQVGATPEGQKKLVGIYVGLARDLQQQMQLADDKSKASLGKGFEEFLSQVAQDATELNVLNWVAETYRGMGESFGPTNKGISADAKRYFTAAADTYKKILEKGEKEKGFLDPAMVVVIRLQQARTTRALGDYKGAVDVYEAILKANPAILPVQIEAAKTYQEWAGKLPPDKAGEYYRSAMMGARPDKSKQDRNTIWGWSQIANITTRDWPKYRETFHEARYNMALCRYQWALGEKDAKRTEALKGARSLIASTAGLYPELGGDLMRQRYDVLLRNIQKALGEKTIGLAALNIEVGPQPQPTGAATGGDSTSSPPPVPTTPTSAKGK
jgi:tetratricopeptide (TPR) repeat protein